jgi:lipopolysaccharide biosynthesis regulator YciM
VQGDMENAKKCFKHAIQCAPQHLEAHFNMGNLYRQCAEFGRAIQRCVCLLPCKG